MGKAKHTGLGKIDVTGAAAVVNALVSPRPKSPRLKSKPTPGANKADLKTSNPDVTNHSLPEFQSAQSEKLQVPMDYELIATLGRIEKWVMANRKKSIRNLLENSKNGQQRITKNSIVRACLKVLLPVLYVDIDELTNISTEQELVDKISNLLKIKKPESKA